MTNNSNIEAALLRAALAQLAVAQAELAVAKQETADYHRWGIAMKQQRDAATVRGNTYRRRALALAQLCRRLENGERILGTGFSVGAARKFVTNEMTARCADCGQMIMLTVQEYIQRRKDSAK